MEKGKIKMNFKKKELELEGSLQFLEEQKENLQHYANIIFEKQNNIDEKIKSIKKKSQKKKKNDKKEEEKKVKKIKIPDNFGKWFYKFKENITKLDYTLIAAYYVQKKSKNDEFKTSQITKILKKNGINLSNTSSNLKRLEEKNFMFPTKRNGNIKFYRISKPGEKYLKSLLKK